MALDGHTLLTTSRVIVAPGQISWRAKGPPHGAEGRNAARASVLLPGSSRARSSSAPCCGRGRAEGCSQLQGDGSLRRGGAGARGFGIVWRH